MAQPEEGSGAPKFDLEGMTRQWQDLMIDSWGNMTKQFVHSDHFAAASSAYMDWALNWQKQMRNNTGQFLDSLEFPKRSDIARLSKQLMAVETRVADMEDRLDKMVNLLGAMSEAMQRMVAQTVAQQQAQARPQQAQTAQQGSNKTASAAPKKSSASSKARAKKTKPA